MKRMGFILAFTAALLLFPAEGRAQNLKTRALNIWNKLMAPDKNLDSTYVFQPFKGWNVSTTYQGRWDHVGLEIPMEIVTNSSSEQGRTVINLIDNQSHHVGLRGGYGPLELGFSVAVNKKEKPDRNISFNWLSTSFSLQFYHTLIHDSATSTFEFPIGNTPDRMPENASSASIWRVGVFYIFNNKKFSYPSAYQGKLVQRRSAGSFLAGAEFHHSYLTLDKSKSFGTMLLNLTGYSTWKFSLGGGYSFNWVLYHRDASSSRNIQDLRNLTLNITAIPLLIVVNEMGMTHITRSEEEKIQVHGGIQPNFLGRVGICYAWGHFYVNGYFDFNYHRFQGKEQEEKRLRPFLENDDAIYRFKVLGHLSNWTGGVELHYRF